ncbi:MAG: DUF2059 domain-containing protein [Prosthecobacter sp.]
MKTLIALATLVLTLSPLHAELSDSHRASIEKLITVLKVKEQFEASLVAGFESGLGASADQIKALPQEQQDKFNNAIAKVKAALLEMMSWEKVKPDLVEVYGKTFSEQEAKDVIAHMETPVGQMIVSKQAGMVSSVMQMTQEKTKVIMPKVMQIMQEEMTK